MKRKTIWLVWGLILIIIIAIAVWDFRRQDISLNLPAVEDFQDLSEVLVVEISLAGDITSALAEVSGLAWYADNLVILPQYPGRFPSEVGGSIFSITKEQIIAYLDGESTDAITPRAIPFDDGGLAQSIPGYQGFEALVFASPASSQDQRVYLTIEAETLSGVSGYVVAGELAADMSALHVSADIVRLIEPQADISNFSEEALLLTADSLLTFYEANGTNINPQPVVHRYGLDLDFADLVPIPNLEYRLTDATSLDAVGRFWVINFLFPGDIEKLDMAEDEMQRQYGVETTHAQSRVVERLVEFQYTPDGIYRTDSAPIYFELLADGTARNWEGLVRLDERGFLMMTDKYPGTIFGYVEYP